MKPLPVTKREEKEKRKLRGKEKRKKPRCSVAVLQLKKSIFQGKN